MRAKFPADVREGAVDRFLDGASGAAVCDWVERECGRRPSVKTLYKWKALRMRGRHASRVHRSFSPEEIAEVVAKYWTSGKPVFVVADECGVSETAPKYWALKYGPAADRVADMTYDEVFEATMDGVCKDRRIIRQNASKRTAKPKQQPMLARPVDEWIPGPGPVPDKHNLPDDPAELKRLLLQELDRNVVKNAMIQALIEAQGDDDTGKASVHDGKATSAVKAAAVGTVVETIGVSITGACDYVGLADSTYYNQPKRAETIARRQQRRDELKVLITQAVEETGCTYGYRRIHFWLRSHGHTVSEKIVRELMAELGLQPPARTFSKYSSYTGETAHRPANLLLVDDSIAAPETGRHEPELSRYFTENAAVLRLTHDFHADAPWVKLGTDVTEIACAEGRLYLSVAIDFYDGKPVAVTMSETANHNLVAAMIKAIDEQKPAGARPIIHSDRGGLYRSRKWVDLITDNTHGIDSCEACTEGMWCDKKWRYIPSLSRKGRSGDNARVEGFFGTMKREILIGRPETERMSRAEMITYINQYIDFYINRRLKSTLGAGYQTIAQHRATLNA